MPMLESDLVDPGNRITRRSILLGSMAVLIPGTARAEALSDPYGPPIVDGKTRVSAKVPNEDCSTVPPISDLSGRVFYSDKAGSKVDKLLLEENKQLTRPLTDFTAALQSGNEAWLTSSDEHAGHCAFALLQSWADNGALLGRFNEQGNASRRFNLVGIAVAALSLRHLTATGSKAFFPIGRWLGAVAAQCRLDAPRLQNNQLNWLAAGSMACAISDNDPTAFNSALALARAGIRQIAPDGSLPFELKRASRALLYHSFALGPLLLAAELASANGVDLYNEHDGALFRLYTFVASNIENQRQIAGLAGGGQVWTGATDNTLPWLELANLRFQDAWLLKNLEKLRPIRYAYLGGNQTLLYRRATLARNERR
jgi:poly(beta-D-mannuronate) lyase